jgi:hypothetical protein
MKGGSYVHLSLRAASDRNRKEASSDGGLIARFSAFYRAS